MTDLSYLKADFPILDDGVHFLDSGASSQKPIQVLEAMDRFARTSYANVHRGAYKLSVAATEAYRRFLALGATVPLPELYRTAGVELSFEAGMLAQLVAMVEEEMAMLRGALARAA